MARKLFGTDGIRGTANREPMTAATALAVAMAAGRRFTNGSHRHRVVIGKDTRLSNYTIEPALQAGFAAMGMDVLLVGPLPTPAVAMLTRSMRCDLGVMVSASHNAFEDNGIKLFGPDGYKLSDEVEAEIEAMVEAGPGELPTAGHLGRAQRLDDAPGRYVEFVKATFPRGLRLDGMRIVVDCAHGAAYKVAPQVFYELGAEIVAIGIEPNGTNINRACGATSPGAVRAAVTAHDAHLGIALDGDADRVILVDETGSVLDGDQVMALVATVWQRAGRLTGGGVVATVMSNLGLEKYLAGLDLKLVRAKVGDRYVLEEMRRGGYNVGGEQSGHIVLADHATTGDGLVAALQVLAAVVEAGRPVSEVARLFTPYPQVLKNVRFSKGTTPHDSDEVRRAVVAAEARLGGDGRILIRPSGTEPVVRVMAEGRDAAMVEGVVGDICAVIERRAALG